jgi:hypothetical protein
VSAPLVRTLAEPHHLLVLPANIHPDELEALAVSRSETAGWAGEADLRLAPGVHLTGPWSLDAELRAAFDLPAWSAEAYLLRCPVQRGGPLPAELRGIDAVLDAFSEGVPVGIEQEALDHLRAFARRLGGALRMAGSGAVVVPDPEAATDLTVMSSVWLDHDACLQVLRQSLPHARSLLDEVPEAAAGELQGYGIVSELEGGDLVELIASGSARTPTVLRAEEWASEGVITYELRWRPAHPETAFAARPPLGVRRTRSRAAELIERAAVALHAVVGGEISDDDGFLVDPADLDA